MSEVRTSLLRFKEALERRDRRLVNGAARDLIDLRAPLGPQWRAVAAALHRNGECSLAVAAANRFAEDTGGHPMSRHARANLLYQCGRLKDALGELASLEAQGLAFAQAQEEVSFLNLRASILLLMGDYGQARVALERVLDLDPLSGQAWLSLTEFADFRERDAEQAERLEGAWETGASIASEGSKLAHAVGRMRHQLGDHEGAFEAFSAGARLFNSSSYTDKSASVVSLVPQSTSFDRDFIRSVASRIRVPHERVIFVTGLPRSGTTLVEHILASHSDVAAGEELGIFRILGQEIGGLDAESLSRWLDKGGDPNALVELYMHLATERLGTDRRFIDKTTAAGNYMGLLLALFPNAPVFWMRRDAIDNGWSAFRTYFARGATWSWDLKDIGIRLADEDRIAQYWQTEASERIHFIDYADLVRTPEPEIRTIAAAAGLELQDQMFRPHETSRVVATASLNQVRQPINLQGLGVASPYRRWLAPMIDAYEVRSSRAAAN